MLTPDYLDTIADPIIELFSKLQEEILSDIVRRVAKTGKVTATAEWQIIKAQESGMLLNDIQEYMQKTLGLSATELQELFEQATIEDLTGHFKNADIVKLLKRDTTMYQSLLAGLEKTQGSLVNLTMSTAESYQTLFFSACDDAYMKIQSGAFDYNSAIVEATNTMLDNSEPVVRYPSGWRNSVDVAVRRAVLTGINQTMGQVQMDLAEELGLDYVDVSAHMGARPDHAVWQGKRYCISGKDPAYPKFEDATGYGTGAGLCGWNCRHTFFPTTKNAPAYYTDSELEAIKNAKVTYNGQEIGYYDATQIQRKYEYQCRNLRKELVALDELPDSPEKTAVFERKSATLKQREAQYKDFSRQTGLLTQTERMRTYGYNKALSQKVGKASREYLEGHKEIKPLAVVSQPKPKQLKSLTLLDKIASCQTTQDVEALMNAQNWFRQGSDVISLKGCDVGSAQSVARAYNKVFEKYPQMIGKLRPVKTESLGSSVLAQCYSGLGGLVEVNTKHYSNYEQLIKTYEYCVQVGFHPIGTKVEDIVTHELGHAIDGYLSFNLGMFGIKPNGFAKRGGAVLRPAVAKELGVKVADMGILVSKYATENPQEWWAECFAEYLGSPNPREVAVLFGQKLEELMRQVR